MPYKEKIKRLNLTRFGQSVDIGERNVDKWNDLKRKLKYAEDPEFVEHLLTLAENQISLESNNILEPKRDQSDESGAELKVALDPPPANEVTAEQGNMESNKSAEDEARQEPEKLLRPCDSNEARKFRRKKFRSGKRRKLLEDLALRNGDSQAEENNSLETRDETPKLEDRSDKPLLSGSTTCQYCDSIHAVETCPLLVPTSVVGDSRVPLSAIKDERAKASLPGILQLKEKNGKDIFGVYAKTNISRCTQFGPLIGVSIKEMEIADDSSMKHVWEVSEGKYLCTSDPDKSNWIRWLCPAPTRHDRNIVPIERNGLLYFVTTASINAGSELFYWAETVGPWASKKMDKTSCGGCNLQFEHPMYYRTHCAVFHEASLSLTVRKYHCKVCGKSVLGKQNIMKHALLNHDGKGAYQCQFCSKFFLRLNYLEMHRNYGCSANPHRARPLCDYCGRKFCQPQKLKVHIKRMHSDLAEVLHEFQCRDCLKILGSTAALQRHTKEVHKRPSSVSCSKCGKTFQNKSNLKIHMLTHSGVKPFQCQEGKCSAAFTTKQCLQFHYKKVHGLTEDRFPSIVRSVEYTFESYAGVKDGNDESDVNENQILDRDPPRHLELGANEEQNSNNDGQYQEEAIDRSQSPTVEPTCEETSVIEYHSSVLATSHNLRRTLLEYPSHPIRNTTPGVIMSGQSNASLLVEAALESVELRLPVPAPSPPPTASPLQPSSPMEPIDVVLPPAEDLRRPCTPHYATQVMYDPIRPSPVCSPQHVTYLSPRYDRHYMTPPPPPAHEFVHDDHRYHEEEMAQNLTKYKYEEARAIYHELIPRYPMTHADYYPWEVLRPAINLPTTVDLSVTAGHLPPPMERPPSPPYQAFHVPQKSPVYHHYTTYY